MSGNIGEMKMSKKVTWRGGEKLKAAAMSAAKTQRLIMAENEAKINGVANIK
jgi:hypothetical protein